MSPSRVMVDSSSGIEEVHVDAVKRLRARREEIEEVIFERISGSEFEPVGGEDAAYMAGLSAAVTAVIDYVLTGIERWGESSETTPAAIPQAAIEQARRAARTGVGWDTMLRRYIAGYALLEGFLTQDADLMAEGALLGEVLKVVAALVDRLVAAASSTYREESERVGRPSSLTRVVESVHMPLTGSQRTRILDAIVEVIAERGMAGASIALVVERAKVSRRTFYERFSGLEDGLVAVIDATMEQLSSFVLQAFEQKGSWRDRMRSALSAMLAFLDANPELARVCLVETLGGGPVVVEHRERVVGELRALVVARIESDGIDVSPLLAEGVMVSVLGVLRTRLIAGEPQSLIALLGPLMGMITAPFVTSEQVAAEEVRRGDELARSIQTEEGGRTEQPRADTRPIPALPSILSNPTARRLRECLLFLAEHKDVSNREVATGIGVTQKSQMSTLLSELLARDLVVKRSEGPGKRNAWRLTTGGEEIARKLVEHD